ncbi:MAG: DNA-binding protein Alba [Candidatus Aenigmarchaeota archaeon]|nr:DNA-binding protein Alba [Candidatus Aenigmarchaeota archaeon]MDI6722795.1 DNA-binding protein Alba [Candidatus Aenigmarchaeota archaeon]
MARKDDNIVYIGKKPTISYVSAIVMQLTSGQNEFRIKARGNLISKAVDVAEIIRNKFIQDAKIREVNIGTQEIEDDKKEKINVSFIEIVLAKGK